MTRVFLAEKPSQARDIARVLGARTRQDTHIEGKGVAITWAYGHLLEMAPPDAYGDGLEQWSLDTLPIIPDQWQVNVRAKVKGHYKAVAKLLRSADEVVLATDADREGETIGRELLDHAGYRGPVRRLWLSALDDKSIRDALDNILPGERTAPLYHAGLARSRADWLVGMNLTRAYTLAAQANGYRGVLSVGRVQTPTLKLVVDRDREIENFQPVPYYELWVTCEHDHGTWSARWQPPAAVADDEGRCLDRRTAAAAADAIANGRGRVTYAETKRKREAAPLPFDLSSLQQTASKRFGFGAQQVLDIAQSLYENHKATTYPRTDCRYLPTSQQAEAGDVLKALAQSDAQIRDAVDGADARVRSRVWNDNKITAHHAIIPTAQRVDTSRMSRDEYKLYDLIRRHYVAQFYPDHEYDHTRIDVTAADHVFVATGRITRKPGWRHVLRPGAQDDDEQQALPRVERDDPVGLSDATIHDKETQPPKRYTEGTLIAAMKNIASHVTDDTLKAKLKETTGIGTEATRAGIIKTLLKRGFLETKKKTLCSTDAARALVDALPAPVKDPGTTGLWEQSLDEIANGRVRMEDFVERQMAWMRQLVEHVQNHGGNAVALAGQGSKRNNQTIGPCACGGSVRESPKAWQCTACEAIVWKTMSGKTLTEKQALALFAGKTIEIKGFKSRRTGKTFDAPVALVDGKAQFQFDKA